MDGHMLLSILFCFLPTLPTGGSSQKLTCRLQCELFECTIPPTMDVSQPVHIKSSLGSPMPCPVSDKPTDPLCRVEKSAKKLVVNFMGQYTAVFKPMNVSIGGRVVFNEKPCLYERPTFDVSVSASEVSIKSSKSMNLCHFDQHVDTRIICFSEFDERIERDFAFNDTRQQRLTGLRPFSRYTCSAQIRYKHPSIGSMSCTSHWSDAGRTTFRTPPAPPSAAPRPLGFLRSGSDCHVYFEALATRQWNGRPAAREYGWRCGERSGSTSLLTFRTDCASRSCVVWARNERGAGPKSSALDLPQPRESRFVPGLQLWSNGSGFLEARPEDEGPSDRSFLMICSCGACLGDFPKCREMKTRPFGDVQLRDSDLRSHRVALLRSSGSGPIMSPWVSCSYLLGAALKISQPLNEEFADRQLVPTPLGDRLKVVLPAAELRCPRASRPVLSVVARRSCGSADARDFRFDRSSTKQDMEIEINQVSGCKVLLSIDKENFFLIYPGASTGLSLGAIAGIVVFVVIVLVVIILVLRFRNTLRNWYKVLCDVPEMESPRMNGFRNPVELSVDGNEGYSLVDDTPITHSYSDNDDEGTRPIREETDDFYTPQTPDLSGSVPNQHLI